MCPGGEEKEPSQRESFRTQNTPAPLLVPVGCVYPCPPHTGTIVRICNVTPCPPSVLQTTDRPGPKERSACLSFQNGKLKLKSSNALSN